MSDFFATPWIIAHQSPLSMDFPGKNTGVGCQFLLQGDLPKPEISRISGGFFTTEPPAMPMICIHPSKIHMLNPNL